MSSRDLDWEYWIVQDQEQWWAQYKQEEEARLEAEGAWVQLELPLEDTRTDNLFG